MAHPATPVNIFNINNSEFVLLNHIIKEADISTSLIGIEPYYQHGAPAVPLFGPVLPQFIYLALEFSCFANDQLAQMTYVVEDENGGIFTIIADSLVAVGPALWTARMKQTCFLLRRIVAIANVDYWEFVGWRLTLEI